MIDGLGRPQRVLLLGAGSAIGLATTRRLFRGSDGGHVVLAGRPGERRTAACQELATLGVRVDVVDLDAADAGSRTTAVDAAFAWGDVDVALVAFGVLGDQERAWQDVESAVELAEVNYVAAVAVGVLLAERMRRQGHGVIVAFSSVAGERARRSNFVYGSTKAGLDAFYTGLREAVRADAVDVVVVRPGFVRTRMTEGLPEAPWPQTPDDVAAVVARAVRTGRSPVWAPGRLRWVMSALRHLPAPVFRRLPQ